MTRAHVSIAPRLILGMDQVEFNHPVGLDTWKLKYTETDATFEIDLSRETKTSLDISFELLSKENLHHLDLTWKSKTLHLRFEKGMNQWTVPGDIGEYLVSVEAVNIAINSLAFCELDTLREIPALLGPEHRLLSEQELTTFSPSSTSILNASDPAHDDRGLSGTYEYPSNPQFEAGIADILEMQVLENQVSYEFELTFSNLVDPGWHPEYGYQLTYCALGISYNAKTGTHDVGKNAQTQFRDGFLADQILYISGGVLLVDASFAPQAEYMPRQASGAIGNAERAIVRFSLPRELFQDLSQATFQLAVGCQDDHGGAGIGDFRPVEALRSEWNGGGKPADQKSNIFDWLLP